MVDEAQPGAPGREGSKLQRQLAGQIARHVRARELPAGTQLTELGLADIFKVSRTPVRAALDLLAQLGFVEAAPRGGFRVAAEPPDLDLLIGEQEGLEEEEALYLRIATDFMKEELQEQFSESDLMRRYDVGRGFLIKVLRRMALDLVIERNQGHGWHFAPMFKSVDADGDSYRYRMIIEPAALLEPGYSIDRVRADASRRAHDQIMAAPAERVSNFHFFDVNAEFHEMLAAGANNSFLLHAVQQQNRLRRLLNLQWPYGDERIVASCIEHMEVLTAIEAGNLQWAAALLRRHLELAAGSPATVGKS